MISFDKLCSMIENLNITDEDIIELLKKHPDYLDLNKKSRSDYGCTMLHIAVNNRRKKLAVYIISKKKECDNLNAINDVFITPLGLAFSNRMYSVAAELVQLGYTTTRLYTTEYEYGQVLSLADELARTLFLYSSKSNEAEELKILMIALVNIGVNINKNNVLYNSIAKSQYRNEIKQIYYSVVSQKFPELKFLVEHIEAGHELPISNDTLILLINNSDIDDGILQDILQLFPQFLNPPLFNKDSNILQAAINNERSDLVLFIASKLPAELMNMKLPGGYTALGLAFKFRMFNMACELVRRGASLKNITADGMSASIMIFAMICCHDPILYLGDYFIKSKKFHEFKTLIYLLVSRGFVLSDAEQEYQSWNIQRGVTCYFYDSDLYLAVQGICNKAAARTCVSVPSVEDMAAKVSQLEGIVARLENSIKQLSLQSPDDEQTSVADTSQRGGTHPKQFFQPGRPY